MKIFYDKYLDNFEKLRFINISKMLSILCNTIYNNPLQVFFLLPFPIAKQLYLLNTYNAGYTNLSHFQVSFLPQ